MNTVTLRESQPIHEVDFHGVTLHISIDMDSFWLAADKNGEVYFYEFEPSADNFDFKPSEFRGSFSFLVARINLNGINWRDTAKRYQV